MRSVYSTGGTPSCTQIARAVVRGSSRSGNGGASAVWPFPDGVAGSFTYDSTAALAKVTREDA
jgi:hypothetical protein